MHTLLVFSIFHSLGAAPPGNGFTYNEAFQHQMIIPTSVPIGHLLGDSNFVKLTIHVSHVHIENYFH